MRCSFAHNDKIIECKPVVHTDKYSLLNGILYKNGEKYMRVESCDYNPIFEPSHYFKGIPFIGSKFYEDLECEARMNSSNIVIMDA